jgi:predicted GNAT superfamily acetyltransferase
MLYMIKKCVEPFKTRIWGSQNRFAFPWEEPVRASIKRVGLVISAGREHGTGMDHIASAPAPLKKKEYCHSHADNDVKANPFLFLHLQAKNKQHDDVQFV